MSRESVERQMGCRVKKIPTPTPPSRPTGTTFRFLKPKPTDPYDSDDEAVGCYCKIYERDAKQELATVEAVGADFARRICGANFTPKVSVLAESPDETTPKSISRTIEFTPASRLSTAQLKLLRNTQQRGLARLYVILLILQNPDLHHSNWGIDRRGNIVMIDFDRIWADYSNSLLSSDNQFLGRFDDDQIYCWDNLIYHPSEYFHIASPDDINMITDLTDAKPYNTPLGFLRGNLRDYFATLDKDPEFIKWKFYYLTKHFILHDDNSVLSTIRDHSIDPKNIKPGLCDRLVRWRDELKDTLLHMPAYRDFLKDTMPRCMGSLEFDVAESNEEFCNKGGETKQHRQHRILDINVVKAKLATLQQEAQAVASAETPETIAHRELELFANRIVVSARLVGRLTQAIAHRQGKIDAMSDRVQEFLRNHNWSAMHLAKCCGRENLITFYISHGIPDVIARRVVKEYAENNRTMEALFLQLQEDLIAFKTKHELQLIKKRDFVCQQIQVLCKISCSAQVKTFIYDSLWDAVEKENPDYLLEFTTHLFEYADLTHLPAKLFLSLGDDKIDVGPFSNFSKLHGFATALRTTSETAQPTQVHPCTLFPSYEQLATTKLHKLVTRLDENIRFNRDELNALVNLFGRPPYTTMQIDFCDVPRRLHAKTNPSELFTITISMSEEHIKLTCPPKKTTVLQPPFVAPTGAAQ